MPSSSLGREGREKIDWREVGPTTAASDNNHSVHALWRARTSMPCLTDANAEVVVLLLQPNQGCSRLESLYYISNIIPHIVGRLYEIITLVS